MGRGEAGDRRRDAILQAVRDFHAEHHYAPTLREVANLVGLATGSAAQYQIRLLVDAGVLAMDPKVARSLRVVEVHSREPL